MSATLQRATYESASLNLSRQVTARIRASRQVPVEWRANSLNTLAHGLYWEERDAEVLLAEAARQSKA